MVWLLFSGLNVMFRDPPQSSPLPGSDPNRSRPSMHKAMGIGLSIPRLRWQSRA